MKAGVGGRGLLSRGSGRTLRDSGVVTVAGERLYDHPFVRRLRHIYGLRPRTVILERGSVPRTRCLSLTHSIVTLYGGCSIRYVLRDFVGMTVRLRRPCVRLPLPVLRTCIGGGMSNGVSANVSGDASGCRRFFGIVKASIRSMRSTVGTRRLKTACVATKRVFTASYGGKLPPHKLSFLGGIYSTIKVPICTVNNVGVTSDSSDATSSSPSACSTIPSVDIPQLTSIVRYKTTKKYVVSKVVEM